MQQEVDVRRARSGRFARRGLDAGASAGGRLRGLGAACFFGSRRPFAVKGPGGVTELACNKRAAQKFRAQIQKHPYCALPFELISIYAVARIVKLCE